MKGIVLAGGSGTRLYPLTKVTSKQLLPVYDKPMIFYPLSTLMLAGIQDILIISTPHDLPNFKALLGDGSTYGISLSYAEQSKPNGLAEAFLIGANFIGNSSCALILGDNIFYGNGFRSVLQKAVSNQKGATIFSYYVDNPRRFGVVETANDGKVVSLEEKPENPKSNYCATGLYFYDNQVINLAKQLSPSRRGELEITDLNCLYINAGSLNVVPMGRGVTWFDVGTIDSLIDAAEFIKMIETRQGIQIAALEEIAYINGWIDENLLETASRLYSQTAYGKYLSKVLNREMLY